MAILGIGPFDLERILITRGDYIVPSIKEPTEQAVLGVDTPITAVQEVEKPDPVEILTQSILELTQNQERLENEINLIKAELIAFKESILIE